jgi:hypothetical protein
MKTTTISSTSRKKGAPGKNRKPGGARKTTSKDFGGKTTTTTKKKTKKTSFPKGSVAKHKSTTLVFGEATFDDEKRKDWVLGYRKRKNGRRKAAAHALDAKAKKERVEARKERRDAEKIALGMFDDPENVKVGTEESEEGKTTTRLAFSSGTTVTVSAM